ncbi:hypothetical protein [Lysinibacillus xylanilyticus]|uniref:hypothetical protein n=1 Tax=Lysinibacillus xylanilyticus TaxID=582475 RepID=UPI003D019DC9
MVFLSFIQLSSIHDSGRSIHHFEGSIHDFGRSIHHFKGSIHDFYLGESEATATNVFM